jgi:3-oxoacyl-[acyl-carrier-protein] synthase II
MTGHLLGAAGALQALFCVHSLETGILPPTTNLENPDPECASTTSRTRRGARPRIALSNSFGFGDTNASVVPSLPGAAS